jgi:hypothetical protein
VIGALLAPWLALLMAEPVALHGCAMHAAPSPVATTAAHAATATDAGDAMAGMHAMSHASATPTATTAARAHLASTTHSSGTDAPSHQHCDCLSGCCTSAPTSLPTLTAAALVASVASAPTQLAHPQVAALVSADHVLPFANGPPANVT